METTKFEDVVELNVGGKLMTTLLDTLTKDKNSLLAAMFSRRQEVSKDKDGRYFIDCNGNVFEHILDFLRFGTLPPQGISLDVYKIARNFQIISLAEQLEIYYPVKYHNQIAEVRKQIESQGYEQLKQKAITGIVKQNGGPHEDKALHFFYQRCNCYLRDIFEGPLEMPSFTIYTNITIDTNFSPLYLTDDMRALLAHELCELGFAKYTATTKESKSCNNCGGDLEHHLVILLSH